MIKKFFYSIKDFKLEILIIIVYILLTYFRKIDFLVLKDLEKDRLISFFSIVSGIYITVLTLMGTTIISITKELLIRSLDKKIINIISLGIIETLISISILIKKDNIGDCYNIFLTSMLIISLISFIKFIIVLILIFKANINAMAKEIDEKEKNEVEFLNILDNINKNLEKIKKLNESK